MKVILIDDEKLALDYLEHQLKSVSDFEIIGKYTSPFAGKKAIEQQAVDLVFLDIQIPDLNGMELAEQLLEKNPVLPIVFVTAYDEYAVKAFELNALDYVLKPVSTDRLITTVDRIKQKTKIKSDSKLVIKKPTRLQLNLFQQVTLFHISEGKKKMIPLKWLTTKTEQIFLYLLQHRGQEVSKTFFIDLLWSDLGLENAYQQLYTTIYHIRKTLGQYSCHFIIQSIHDGYKLQLEDIDVKQFETITEPLLSINTETISTYEKALAIFKGDYLQAYDYIWAESERQRLQMQWIRIALKVIDWYNKQNEFEKALTLALDICVRYPFEEEAHFFLMKIYNSIGNFSAVHQQYQKLNEVLQTELQVEPRQDIVKWYEQWNKKVYLPE